jgi:hypothetical protein
MNKTEFKELIKECVGEVLEENVMYDVLNIAVPILMASSLVAPALISSLGNNNSPEWQRQEKRALKVIKKLNKIPEFKTAVADAKKISGKPSTKENKVIRDNLRKIIKDKTSKEEEAVLRAIYHMSQRNLTEGKSPTFGIAIWMERTRSVKTIYLKDLPLKPDSTWKKQVYKAVGKLSTHKDFRDNDRINSGVKVKQSQGKKIDEKKLALEVDNYIQELSSRIFRSGTLV